MRSLPAGVYRSKSVAYGVKDGNKLVWKEEKLEIK